MIEDYVRNAQLVRVVDGDTYEVLIDLGFRIWKKERVRLYGVNCPEMHGEQKDAALAAKLAVQKWFDNHRQLQIKTHSDKYDSFGRLLAEVWSGTESLADYITSNNYGVAYAPILAEFNREQS